MHGAIVLPLFYFYGHPCIENTALAALSEQLESEKKMSLAKSHQIQKYERELKQQIKERDHKGTLLYDCK